MQTDTGRHIIHPKFLSRAMDYETYKKVITDLLAEHKVTGPVQSELLTSYTKLNVHRMRRIEKTIELLPDVKKVLEKISSPQTWLVLTEGWCGDAAQIVPVIHAMATINQHIQLQMLLRDENPELMDLYLTNGKSRSIPKLVALSSTREEIFNWGPRPDYLQKRFYQLKNEGMAHDMIKEDLHRWYAKDRTHTIQQEIGTLLNTAIESGNIT